MTLQFLVNDRTYLQNYLHELETSNLVGGFVLGMPSRRTNNFPESGRGLGHVTLTIFGSTVDYPSDSLASCCWYGNMFIAVYAIIYLLENFIFVVFNRRKERNLKRTT